MTAYSESKVVPYPADLMYRIAADVERYPEFLPWVVAQRILKRETDGAHEVLLCETLVGFKGLRERYTSRATLVPEERRIDVVQVDGVFRRMETHWRCTPETVGEDAGCRVDFAIDFEFRSRVLAAVVGSVFHVAIARMTKAFQDRARVLSEKALQQ